MVSKGRQFRDLINAPEILIQPGIYDGYTARFVEQSGFKTASISGAGVSERVIEAMLAAETAKKQSAAAPQVLPVSEPAAPQNHEAATNSRIDPVR